MGGLIYLLKIEAKTKVVVLTFEDRSESELGSEKFKTNSPFFIARTAKNPQNNHGFKFG